MINTKDVIRIKIPYPSINDNLALHAHMYICKTSDSSLKELVKCQTLKPYMLIHNTIQHYCDEQPDIQRNPFNHVTRIDCDKLFSSNNVLYDLNLRTTSRVDICQELYDEITNELEKDGYQEIMMNQNELTSLNPLITPS
nr:hypothetical protein [uncultured Mediterraneibacter sp.]